MTTADIEAEGTGRTFALPVPAGAFGTAARIVLGTVLIVVPVFLFSTLITFLLGAASG